MEGRENSKVLQQHEQEQYKSNLYPMFSTMEEFNVQKQNNSRTNRGNADSIVPNEASSDDPLEEHAFPKSDSDSCSEECGDASDEEVSFDELLHDGKAKKKIQQLAAMVGVDSMEPAIVLTEVVRVLKHLKTINHYYSAA
ncbi:hypothetical protein VNO77_00281 [Canavalia gladiata]|uniref:Uncharacterized protein n=1 Tax=Canavalia gladiata TaxID=3824 RepID=A0AAN9R558_CANGL